MRFIVFILSSSVMFNVYPRQKNFFKSLLLLTIQFLIKKIVIIDDDLRSFEESVCANMLVMITKIWRQIWNITS
ncbi:hypothetical protein CJF27_13650 [Photobacterium iliopiscarium]|nr:hypothetical protein [Photobacterium iliopiscarium]